MANEVKIADPGPLGLAAFALTTFVLSCINAGFFKGIDPVFLPIALAYGGFAQLLAGMWEFRSGNTFGATAFTSYGAFWISLGIMVWMEIKGVLNFGTSGGTALGLFLLAWTIFTVYMWIGSFKTNTALATVFTVLMVTFVLLVIGTLGGSAGAAKLGGYMGILTAFAAWYTSAAGVLNPMFGREVLPVGAKK